MLAPLSRRALRQGLLHQGHPLRGGPQWWPRATVGSLHTGASGPPTATATTTTATSSASESRRILCVDVPAAIAETTCVQELVQRGHVVDQVHGRSGPELTALVGDYDALLVAPSTPLPRELLAAGARARLEVVAVPADAIDSGRVDILEATNQGLVLLQLEPPQVGDKSSVEAELGLSLLLQLARHIPASAAATRATAAADAVAAEDRRVPLHREAFTGTELLGKRLGIVGLGQAGKRVVDMARALGLEVAGFDPNLTHEAAALMGVKRLGLDELYATSDVLAFHAPLTARTRGMFDRAALAKCKDGVRLVAVAEHRGRQGLVDVRALVDGLDSGKIAGVAMDLIDGDGDSDDLDHPEAAPLWERLAQDPRVLLQRHGVESSTAAADSALGKRYRAIAENLSDALAGRYYRGVANGVFMPVTLVPEMKPFLDLGESLGRLLFHLVVTNDPKDPITKVTIATTGGLQVDITSPKAKAAIQSAVMKGILDCINAKRGGNGFETPRISLLNSAMLAMTNGIDVRSGDLAGRDAAHLNNSITVFCETRNKERLRVMGSVFGEDPRVVRINEYTDFPAFRPEGNLLIFKNEDKPGAIAGILLELAEAKINIANFGLSRQAHVPLALGILSLDALPSDETIARLKALPTVEKIQFARV